MFALLSPNELNALHRYRPASFIVGSFRTSDSKNLFFFIFLHSKLILLSFFMTLKSNRKKS